MSLATLPALVTDAQTGVLIEAAQLLVVPAGASPITKLPVFTDNVGNTGQPKPVQIVGLDGFPVVANYDYVANGVDDTAQIQAMIDRAIADRTSAQMLVRGSAAIWDTLWVMGLGLNSSLTFEADAIQCWLPNDPDNSLHGFIGGDGDFNNRCAPGFRLRVKGLHRYFPEITWQGKCESFDGTYIYVTPDPNFPLPLFETMNVLHGYVGELRKFSQFEFRGKGSQLNFPVTRMVDGRLRLAPPIVTGAVTGVSNMNPLEVMISPTGNLYNGIPVAASTFVGLLTSGGSGPSGLNGIAGLTLQIDDDVPNRAIVLLNGAQIDASSWSAYVSGGLFTSGRMPPWLFVGQRLVGVVRKRGDAEIDPLYAKDWDVEANVQSAQGVFLKGKFWENIRARIKTQPLGLLSGTAGCVILAEVRGRADVEAEGIRYGDDAFNIASYKWGPFVIAGSITSTGLSVDSTKVWAPMVGDPIAFEKNGNRTISPITAVSFGAVDGNGVRPTAVTVATPVGLDATWDITNLNVAPAPNLGETVLEGAARGIRFPLSGGRVKGIVARHMRGAIITKQNPNSSAHPNQSTFKGGGLNGSISGEDVAKDYVDKANAAIVTRLIGANGAAAGNAGAFAGVKPEVWEPIALRDYGFSALWTEGVPNFCPQVTLFDPGTERANHPRTIAEPTNPANFDIVAIAAPWEIGALNRDALLWVKLYEQYGGRVIIGNRLSRLLKWSVDPAVDILLQTVAYGTFRVPSGVAIAAPRKITLKQAGMQDADPWRGNHLGSGSAVNIWDEASNTQIGSMTTSSRTFEALNDGTNWLPA